MKKFLIFICLILISNVLFCQRNKIVWKNIGPNPYQFKNKHYTGRINFCKKLGNTYLYGSSTGGLWTKKNDTNYCLTNNLPGGANDITFNSADSNEFYFDLSFYANGKFNNGRYSYGIYFTKDGGKNIEQLIALKPAKSPMIVKMRMSKQNDTLFVLTYKSLLAYIKSKNKLFTLLSVENNKSFLDMSILANGKILISGTSMLFTFDAEKRKKRNLLPDFLTKNSFIKVDTYKNSIWAVVYRKGKTDIILKFKDEFSKPQIITKNLSLRSFVGDIWVFNDSVAYTGGVVLYFSKDSFNTLSSSHLKIHPDVRNVTFLNNKNFKDILISSDGGAYRVNSAHQTILISDTSLFQSYSFSSDIYQKKMICGVHDNGVLYSEDGKKWDLLIIGDGAGTTISKDGSLVIGSIKGNFYTINNKNNFQRIKEHNPLNGVEPVVFSDSSIIFPSYSKKISKAVLYLKKGNQLQAIDSAWGLISSLYIDKKTNKIYYATYGRWAKKYVNLFEIEIDKQGKYQSRRIFDEKLNKIQKISSITAIGDSIWFCLDGFQANHKVFFSPNRGNNWQNISNNIENVPVYSICYIADKDLLICGGDFGIKKLENHRWKKIKNFPTVAVTAIKYYKEDETIYVSTYGRGCWLGEIVE